MIVHSLLCFLLITKVRPLAFLSIITSHFSSTLFFYISFSSFYYYFHFSFYLYYFMRFSSFGNTSQHTPFTEELNVISVFVFFCIFLLIFSNFLFIVTTPYTSSSLSHTELIGVPHHTVVHDRLYVCSLI